MNKVLVLDDEESIQRLYFHELTEEGYDVFTSSDGAAILDLIEQNDPDVVVLDIRLGPHNGLDLLQEIRNKHYDLPVILCTAYPSFKYDLKSIAADYYVVKSADLRELKFKIRSALEGGDQLASGTVRP